MSYFNELHKMLAHNAHFQAATNAAEILDNVEEWPTEVVEQKSNQ